MHLSRLLNVICRGGTWLLQIAQSRCWLYRSPLRCPWTNWWCSCVTICRMNSCLNLVPFSANLVVRVRFSFAALQPSLSTSGLVRCCVGRRVVCGMNLAAYWRLNFEVCLKSSSTCFGAVCLCMNPRFREHCDTQINSARLTVVDLTNFKTHISLPA